MLDFVFTTIIVCYLHFKLHRTLLKQAAEQMKPDNNEQ